MAKHEECTNHHLTCRLILNTEDRRSEAGNIFLMTVVMSEMAGAVFVLIKWQVSTWLQTHIHCLLADPSTQHHSLSYERREFSLSQVHNNCLAWVNDIVHNRPDWLSIYLYYRDLTWYSIQNCTDICFSPVSGNQKVVHFIILDPVRRIICFSKVRFSIWARRWPHRVRDATFVFQTICET